MHLHYHLAQANVARMLAPLDSDTLEGFRKQLAAINAAADHSPGFVWRLQTEAGDSTSIRAHEDELILFNMSVWTSIEDLSFYAYRGAHSGPFRDRKHWFQPLSPAFALWWIPAGTLPTVADGLERLDHLRGQGTTPGAFTFKSAYPPPGSGSH